jgi:hypothetical protein
MYQLIAYYSSSGTATLAYWKGLKQFQSNLSPSPYQQVCPYHDLKLSFASLLGPYRCAISLVTVRQRCYESLESSGM